MASGFAEHVLHQLGRAVGDLGLVGEIGRAELTNTPSLTTCSTRSSEPKRRLHLREQHDPAAARGGGPGVEVDILAQPAFDQAAVLGEADLARDVQQAIGLDGRDVGRDRGGGLREG